MLRLLIAALALVAAPAAAQERTIPITDFDRIVVEGPFEVRLVRGNVTRATVSGARSSQDAISLDMQGQTLRIRRNPNVWGSARGAPAAPARVTLSTRSLRAARVIGAGSLSIDGISGQRLDLALEGSGRISGSALQIDQLSAGLRGTGIISLAGAAARLTADIQGAGAFDARSLRVENATLGAATSGSVALTVQRTATVTASGVGEVEVDGPAACTVSGRSAGNVRCRTAR